MTSRWFFSAVWILLAPIWVCSTYAEEPLRPKMVIQELEFDYGAVDEGKVIEHSFLVLNQGSAPLEIVRVRPG